METFQDKIKRERTETRKPFIAKTNEILKAFGNGYRLKLDPESYDFRPEIIGNSEHENFHLEFSNSYGTKQGRISISFYTPFKLTKHGNSYSDGPNPSITVSIDKTGKQIKRDIEKRLFPSAKLLLEKLTERKTVNDQHINRLQSRIAQVESLTPFTLGKNHQKGSTDATLNLWMNCSNVYGDIRLYGSKDESFELKLRGLSLKQIINMTKLI